MRVRVRKWNGVLAAGCVMLGMAAGALGQDVHVDVLRTKSSDSVRELFAAVTRKANRSTVVIKAKVDVGTKSEQVAFGTVMSADGFIVSKASEVKGRDHLEVMVGDGPVRMLGAKVVGVDESTDLVLLKVEATDLVPAEWVEGKVQGEVGSWVATAGPVVMEGSEPVAVGVVAVGRRRVMGEHGILGVRMWDTADHTGATIWEVQGASGAAKAGVRVSDVITKVEGTAVKSAWDLRVLVNRYQAGDVVNLTVRRGDAVMEMSATLGLDTTADEGEPLEVKLMRMLGGAVSGRASRFPAVFEHDTVVRPVDCGGPVVDLSGKVVGVNIARAGRTETYALPADVVLGVVKDLEGKSKSGKE